MPCHGLWKLDGLWLCLSSKSWKKYPPSANIPCWNVGKLSIGILFLPPEMVMTSTSSINCPQVDKSCKVTSTACLMFFLLWSSGSLPFAPNLKLAPKLNNSSMVTVAWRSLTFLAWQLWCSHLPSIHGWTQSCLNLNVSHIFWKNVCPGTCIYISHQAIIFCTSDQNKSWTGSPWTIWSSWCNHNQSWFNIVWQAASLVQAPSDKSK